MIAKRVWAMQQVSRMERICLKSLNSYHISVAATAGTCSNNWYKLYAAAGLSHKG